MAELVLGAGSSHSPMVTLDAPGWLEWGQRDHRHPMLYTRDGRNVSYDTQLARLDGTPADRATPEQCEAGVARVQTAVAELSRAIADASIDIVVIVGDDQDEHLGPANLPPFCIYWGDEITNRWMGNGADLSSLARRYLPGYKELDADRSYPVATGLASYLISQAITADFDVASSRELPNPDQGMGHAFGFPLRRLLADNPVPVVPIMINTYYPPTQPRATRCAAFGELLRRAIESYPGDERVAVIASGGLSHFLVLEDLDAEVLRAFGRHDLKAVMEIPEATWVAGTSEIKNWITVAAACAGYSFEVVDYVPGYRTPAGTGVGLGFALWRG